MKLNKTNMFNRIYVCPDDSNDGLGMDFNKMFPGLKKIEIPQENEDYEEETEEPNLGTEGEDESETGEQEPQSYDPSTYEGKFKEMINIKDASSGIELNCASISLDFDTLSQHAMSMRDYMINTNINRFKSNFRRYIG